MPQPSRRDVQRATRERALDDLADALEARDELGALVADTRRALFEWTAAP